MPGSGRPGDPVCFAIGFGIVTIAGLFLHQFWAGAAIGLVLGGTLALIREDAKRNYRRPADPLWFLIGLVIGSSPAIYLHHAGLSWKLSLLLGLPLGALVGAISGTARADMHRNNR